MTSTQAGMKDTISNATQSVVNARTEQLHGFTVRINDDDNYYILHKDIFQKRIYHFDTDVAAPLVIDAGANIGMSTLYFKHIYPDARVIAFEPDPVVVEYLAENVEANGLANVKIVQAALSDTSESQTLFADGKYSSTLEACATQKTMAAGPATKVPCVRLYDYLTDPVDFLKMNIEGAEWNVLNDAQDRLDKIRSMVIEYHHLPGLPRTLHKILELFDRCGFEYLVNDFDNETNPHVQPPFQLTSRSSYYLLIYAQRRDTIDVD